MNNKTPQQKTEEVIKIFMKGNCSCKFMIITTKHDRNNCPYYTWNAEKDFIRQTLKARDSHWQKKIEEGLEEICENTKLDKRVFYNKNQFEVINILKSEIKKRLLK